MTMTQLQRDALARPKAGDWELADAMELVELVKVGPPAAVIRACGEYDLRLLCGITDSRRVRYLAWGRSIKTPHAITDFNGRLIPKASWPPMDIVRTMQWAFTVLDKYNYELALPNDAEAATASMEKA